MGRATYLDWQTEGGREAGACWIVVINVPFFFPSSLTLSLCVSLLPLHFAVLASMHSTLAFTAFVHVLLHLSHCEFLFSFFLLYLTSFVSYYFLFYLCFFFCTYISLFFFFFFKLFSVVCFFTVFFFFTYISLLSRFSVGCFFTAFQNLFRENNRLTSLQAPHCVPATMTSLRITNFHHCITLSFVQHYTIHVQVSSLLFNLLRLFRGPSSSLPRITIPSCCC